LTAAKRAAQTATTRLPDGGGQYRVDVAKTSTDSHLVFVVQRKVERPATDQSPWEGCYPILVAREQGDDRDALTFGEHGSGNEDKIAQRFRARYLQEVEHATSMEIRKAEAAAVREAGGVSTPSGLAYLPGEGGLAVAEAIAAWMRASGNTADVIRMWNTPDDLAQAATYSENGLQAEINDLMASIQETVGNEAKASGLRNRLSEIRQTRQRVTAQIALKSASIEALNLRLAEAEAVLEQAASQRNIDLDREVSAAVLTGLADVLATVRQAAQARDPEAIAAMAKTLVHRERNARAANFGGLWKRLRRQVASVAGADVDEARYDAIAATVLAAGRQASIEVAANAHLFADVGGLVKAPTFVNPDADADAALFSDLGGAA